MEQLLALLARPTVFLPALIGLAVLRMWRRRREKVSRLLALTVPLALLAILSLPVVAWLTLGTLEWQFAPLAGKVPSPAVLVVLTGYRPSGDDEGAARELGHDTFYRCMQAVTLYQRISDCKILVSGGLPGAAPPGARLAAALQAFFLDQGVEPGDLIVENRSRNTSENAAYSARLLREHAPGRRVVLITDARHMLRATLCFRREGIDVRPAPCNFLTRQFRHRWESYLPTPSGAAQFQEAFQEWLALAYYWLRGRI